jgi:hypothetical protein
MKDKDLLELATMSLTDAIKLALPTIHKQAGDSTLKVLGYRFPQGEFTELKLEMRLKKSFWQRNPMLEFRVTNIKGYLLKGAKNGS